MYSIFFKKTAATNLIFSRSLRKTTCRNCLVAAGIGKVEEFNDNFRMLNNSLFTSYVTNFARYSSKIFLRPHGISNINALMISDRHFLDVGYRCKERCSICKRFSSSGSCAGCCVDWSNGGK